MSTQNEKEQNDVATAEATQEAPLNGQQSETKKVIRRGVATAIGASRKKFDVRDAQQNGLFLVHIDNVEVSDVNIGEQNKGTSFSGMNVPRLAITFASNHSNPNDRRYITLSFMPVDSTVDTIPGGKEEWKFNAPINWLKHILDTFNRNLTDEEQDALSIKYQDFDENGYYIPVEPEDVVNSWRSLFQNFVAIVNNNGNPIYTKGGRPIHLWIKLLKSTKSKRKKEWKNVANGELGVPQMVGSGIIELFEQNKPCSINIDPTFESIKIVAEDKPKEPTDIGTMAPGMMPGAAVNVMGGIGTDNFNAQEVNFNDIGDDMPF